MEFLAPVNYDEKQLLSKLESRNLEFLYVTPDTSVRILDLLEEGYGDNSIKIVSHKGQPRFGNRGIERRIFLLLPKLRFLEALDLHTIHPDSVDDLINFLRGSHHSNKNLKCLRVTEADSSYQNLSANFETKFMELMGAICGLPQLKTLTVGVSIFTSIMSNDDDANVECLLPPNLVHLTVHNDLRPSRNDIKSRLIATIKKVIAQIGISKSLETVRVNWYLRSSLSRCQTDDFIKLLVDSLKVNTSLQVFSMPGVYLNIGIKGKTMLIDMLKSNYNLTEFEMHNCHGAASILEHAKFYAKLNKLGRSSLMMSSVQELQPTTTTKRKRNDHNIESHQPRPQHEVQMDQRWIDVMSRGSDDLSILYYFLRHNPNLCNTSRN